MLFRNVSLDAGIYGIIDPLSPAIWILSRSLYFEICTTFHYMEYNNFAMNFQLRLYQMCNRSRIPQLGSYSICTLRPMGPAKCRKSHFNALCPSDAIWRQISRPTFAHGMACCHYLNQCWFINNKVQGFESNFTRDTPTTNNKKLRI